MKGRKVILLDDAVLDLELGFQFYELQEKGLGSHFLNSLVHDINSLQKLAGIHAQHYGCKRLLSRHFPFSIYYKMDVDMVYVLAVLDMRQNPNGIRRKLNKRP